MGIKFNNRKFLPDCGSTCYYPPISPIPPLPVYADEENQTPTSSKHTKTSTYLIIAFAIVATAFFFLCCFAIYVKFFSHRNRTRRRTGVFSQQQAENGNVDEDEDEDGQVIDHPIWYIRTTGLQQSIIGAITVCKYKKGQGLIEGTECSVCLSEFQEDENLRLLPKCNHAFHLPCIDTWLRSHTNCPLCRAPIVSDPTRIPNLEPNSAFEFDRSASSSVENSQTGVSGNSAENSDSRLRNNGEEERGQEDEVRESGSSVGGVINVQPRRSVSLDSSEISNINLALQTVLSVESCGNSKRVSGGNQNLGSSAKGSSSSRTRYLQSAPTSMKRSRSFNGKHLLSWNSRSQKKQPNAPLRSF